MIFWKVFQQQSEFVKRFDGQEVGVINDGNDEFALGVEVAGFGDETRLALVVVACCFELLGGAEQAQEVVPGVQGAVDDGCDPIVWDRGG